MQVYPAELEASIVLPAIRRKLCEIASGFGIKQKDIATLLGVTEAAASQYLKGKRASDLEFDFDFKNKVNQIVKKILEKKISGFEAVQTLATEFRLSGRLCELHDKVGGIGPETCGLMKVCLK